MRPVRDGPVEEVVKRCVVGVVHERALHHVHDVTLIRVSLFLVRNLRRPVVEAKRVEDDRVEVVHVTCKSSKLSLFFKKWAKPGLFLFIFVLLSLQFQ